MSTVIKMSNETINANQTTVKTTTKKNSADIYSTNASNYASSKKNSFDDSLKKANNKVEKSSKYKDDTKITNKDDDSKLNVNEEKLDEEKEVVKHSSEEISEILANILNVLNKVANNEDIDANANILETLVQQLNGTGSSEDVNELMQKLLEMMKNDSVSDALNSDSLNSIQDLLKQLSLNLGDDENPLNTDLKNNINNLISQISDMLGDKQGEKVLSLEEMLNNKNFSQDGEELFNEQSDNMLKNTDKASSKEDDFLSKFLGKDEDPSSAKINMFATRQAVQSQSAQSTNNLSVNKLTFAQDLIKDVKFMVTNSIKELTVKVNPGNLGEITIRLVQEDGIMKANLKANSKETAALLAQNVEQIKSQLAEQNVKIAEVNIELYQDDTTFYSQEGFDSQLSKESNNNEGNSNRSINSVSSGIEEIDEIVDAIDNSNVNFLA